MKNKKMKNGLYLVTLAAFVATSGIFAEESGFVPGDDRIIEKDILRRIQNELGTDIAKEKQGANEAAARKAEEERRAANVDHTLRSVTLSLKEGRQVSGTVVLSQRSVAITPENSTQELEVPLEEIRSVEFVEWKARRIRLVQPEKDPAAAEAAEASEKAPEGPEGTPAAEGDAASGDGASEADTKNAPAANAGEKPWNVRIYYLPSKCRITKSDETVLEGACRSMDWLGFSMSGRTIGAFRAYYAEEREIPEGGVREVEKSLDEMEAESPVDTVISVELGGFVPERNSGTAVRSPEG